jgi:hypothetical protein
MEATMTKSKKAVKAESVKEVTEVKPEEFDVIKNAEGVKQHDKPEVKPNLRLFLKELIQSGKFSQRQILDQAHEKFPHLLRNTISTILSDSKNKKYSKWEFLVKVSDNGIYSFSDEKVK